MKILIDKRLGTAPYWMPVERGWSEPETGVEIIESPSPAQIRGYQGILLVDALLASTVLNSSLILTDFAVAADTISLLTMVTSERPDGIESATVATPHVSLTGRAVAEIVIPEFYGISVTSWLDGDADVGPRSIRVTEDERALLPSSSESDFHEDLGRAWFLMTETPFVSHVCLVSEHLYRDDPDTVRNAASDMRDMLRAADDQRRLLRRNVSRDHDIDRELVVDVFDGLKFNLSPQGVNGLSTLYGQTGVLARTGPVTDRVISIE